MKTRAHRRRETIWVRAARTRYPVWVGAGLLAELGRTVRDLDPNCSRLFLISSPRIWSLWGIPVARSLRSAGVKAETLLVDDGEENKRLHTVESLAEGLLRRGADRSSLLAALGGGVIGDVTGFLAASYMRGVAYLQLPTTVVAQVDSSVGGKTGVNLRAGKNLLGAFYPPRGVVVDPKALQTLPDPEYRAGLYEVVKCAVIGDLGLFRFLEQRLERVQDRDPAALEVLVRRTLRFKAGVVGRDEFERNSRQVLNFGHTIGHALEALSGYRLRHGEAVGWGMIAATRLAENLGRLQPSQAERILTLLDRLGPLPALPRLSAARLYEQLFADKKAREGKLRFVLPRRIGRVDIVSDVPRSAVLSGLAGLLGARPAS